LKALNFTADLYNQNENITKGYLIRTRDKIDEEEEKKK